MDVIRACLVLVTSVCVVNRHGDFECHVMNDIIDMLNSRFYLGLQSSLEFANHCHRGLWAFLFIEGVLKAN